MNALILVETQRNPVDESIDRHLRFLPADWIPIVVCSAKNEDMIKCKKYIVNPITPDRYYHDYNQLFARPEFWRTFTEYERVMICHQDSGLLRTGVEDFMQYDYVGAPWVFQDHGGNGGLSLRNPRTMTEIALRFRYSLREYEDVFFCNRMHENNIGKLAPRKVCERFSCETIFALGTFGYHGIEKYMTADQVKKVLNQYKK